MKNDAIITGQSELAVERFMDDTRHMIILREAPCLSEKLFTLNIHQKAGFFIYHLISMNLFFTVRM